MFKNLINFSMDLYDLDSGITFRMSTDNITIEFNDRKKQMVLWIQDNDVYPEVVHNLDSNYAIPLDTVMKVLEITKKYL
ncbi:MAG: hypothetical protein ACLTXM_19825 [Enterococcus sp.]|uniref:hypothetical protein n=1 Tax=Enterococcus sp. TaxID=35783 RepID=UPI003991017F